MSDSDSENSNLSELEEEDAVSVEENGKEEGDTKELNEVLNDVEETEVKWSDLVIKILKHMVFDEISRISFNFVLKGSY